jgi:hypothetical protein
MNPAIMWANCQRRHRTVWRAMAFACDHQCFGRARAVGIADVRRYAYVTLKLSCSRCSRESWKECICLARRWYSCSFSGTLYSMLATIRRGGAISQHLFKQHTRTISSNTNIVNMTDPSKYKFNHTMLRFVKRPQAFPLSIRSIDQSITG